jgi:hypothetical protein
MIHVLVVFGCTFKRGSGFLCTFVGIELSHDVHVAVYGTRWPLLVLSAKVAIQGRKSKSICPNMFIFVRI